MPRDVPPPVLVASQTHASRAFAGREHRKGGRPRVQLVEVAKPGVGTSEVPNLGVGTIMQYQPRILLDPVHFNRPPLASTQTLRAHDVRAVLAWATRWEL